MRADTCTCAISYPDVFCWWDVKKYEPGREAGLSLLIVVEVISGSVGRACCSDRRADRPDRAFGPAVADRASARPAAGHLAAGHRLDSVGRSSGLGCPDSGWDCS
jgi:hypothetical protein